MMLNDFNNILIIFLIFCVKSAFSECNIWPNKSVILDLRGEMKGDVYFPGDSEFDKEAWVGNYRFSATPGLVVMPEDYNDVRAILKFAKTHSLRPTIKSSGHDFIGRNTDEGSLHINLAKMKNMTVDNSSSGASMWAEPGASWKDVYEEADKYNMLAVGGSTHTVALGGYYGGGGHSPLTPTFGLGVDSLIGIQMVTADGDLLTVTKDLVMVEKPDGALEMKEDTELFWALRGGGGVFGVVTNYKLALYPNPKEGFSRFIMKYPMVHPIYGAIGKEVLEHVHTQLLGSLSDGKWGGYIMYLNYDPKQEPAKNTGYILLTMLFHGPYNEAKQSAEEMVSFHPEWTAFNQWYNYTTFWEYEKTIDDPWGGYYYTFSRHMQSKDYLTDSGLAAYFIDGIQLAPLFLICTSTLIGGQKGKAMEFEVSSSSVPSYFRSAVTTTTCVTLYIDVKDADYVINTIHDVAKEKFYKFGEGSYYNEPDQYLENWKTDYWGSMENYERLNNTKKTWDPDGMFYCLHCVGSDDQPGPCFITGGAAKAYMDVVMSLFSVLLSLICSM